MKLVLNEQLKYRLVGLVVVMSLTVIFLPAIMKHSNQRFDESMNLSFRLPKKPLAPQVARVDKKNIFKSVKIATITMPPVEHVHTDIVKATPVSLPPVTATAIQVASRKPSQIQGSGLASDLVKRTAKSSDYFAIQLATFSKQANADALVSHLRKQGFEANSQVINRDEGPLYQVIVGQLKQREQAIDLQRKLVNNTQLNGLIITTKVS